MNPYGNIGANGVSNSQYSPMYFSNPYQQTTNISSMNYQNPFANNQPMSQLLNTYGGQLAPQQAFSSQLPYDNYAAPQRAAFNDLVNNVYRPEYQRFNADPFNQNYAANAAANGSNNAGGGAYRYDTQNKQQEQQGYYNPLENMRNQYENMIRTGYNQRATQNYNSPGAFNNIGK